MSKVKLERAWRVVRAHRRRPRVLPAQDMCEPGLQVRGTRGRLGVFEEEGAKPEEGGPVGRFL